LHDDLSSENGTNNVDVFVIRVLLRLLETLPTFFLVLLIVEYGLAGRRADYAQPQFAMAIGKNVRCNMVICSLLRVHFAQRSSAETPEKTGISTQICLKMPADIAVSETAIRDEKG
jgi:hypothetical protein